MIKDTINFRSATTNDINYLLELQSLCYDVTLLEDRSVFYNILKTSPFNMVLCHNETIIGYILAHPIKKDEIPDLNIIVKNPPINENNTMFIHDISIHPNYRNKQLSTIILNAFISMIIPLSYRYIQLVSVNNTAAYWKKHGFSECFNITKDLSSYNSCAIVMERSISGLIS